MFSDWPLFELLLGAIACHDKVCYHAPVRAHTARVIEIQSAPEGFSAWLACPAQAIPAAGQYVLAVDPEDAFQPLPVPLFPVRISKGGFLATSPLQVVWTPGTTLEIRGSLGHGFKLPPTARNVSLVGLGASTARLMPLIPSALDQGAAVALFSDAPLAQLPLAVEAYPLSALPELLPWADFIAIDLPIAALPELRTRLGLSAQEHLPFPGQALVLTPVPCGGMAECGVCAVPGRRGWKLACEHGPVFQLDEIKW